MLALGAAVKTLRLWAVAVRGSGVLRRSGLRCAGGRSPLLGLARSFVLSFACSFVRSFVRSFVLPGALGLCCVASVAVFSLVGLPALLLLPSFLPWVVFGRALDSVLKEMIS